VLATYVPVVPVRLVPVHESNMLAPIRTIAPIHNSVRPGLSSRYREVQREALHQDRGEPHADVEQRQPEHRRQRRGCRD